MLELRFVKGRKDSPPPKDVVSWDKSGRVCLVARESEYYPLPHERCRCEVVRDLASCRIVAVKEVWCKVPVIKREIFKKCGHVVEKEVMRYRWVPVDKLDDYSEINEKTRDKYCPECFRKLKRQLLEEQRLMLQKIRGFITSHAALVREWPDGFYALRILPKKSTLEKVLAAIRHVRRVLNHPMYRIEGDYQRIFMSKKAVLEVKKKLLELNSSARTGATSSAN